MSETSFRYTSEITVNQIMQCGSDSHLAAAAWVSTSAEEVPPPAPPLT